MTSIVRTMTVFCHAFSSHCPDQTHRYLSEKGTK